MGKKLIIKDADFSANGFMKYFVNPDKLILNKYGILTNEGKWLIQTSGEDNMYMLCDIPANVTKLIVDASTMRLTTHGLTAPSSDSSIIWFLTGEPENKVNGGSEPAFIERHLIQKGSAAEINIPSNATILMIHTGYWDKIPFSFIMSRLAKSMYMTDG